MANLGFTLRSTFGLLPKTDKIETGKQLLEEEYAKLQEFGNSDLLSEYLELKAYLDTSEFRQTKNEILGLNFKGSSEQKKEARYLKLKKDKGISNYLKLVDSTEYKSFIETQNSETLAEYKQLLEQVNSSEHNQAKLQLKEALKSEQNKKKELAKLSKDKSIKNYLKTVDSADLKNYLALKESDELNNYNRLSQSADEEDKKEFNALKKQSKFVSYFKFENSKQLANYNALHGGEKISHYTQLKEYVESSAYQEALNSYTFEQSPEFKAESRLAELKNNSEIKQWIGFEKSKAYKLFQKTEGSELLNEYQNLHEEVNSEEFISRKAYLLDKDKFKSTPEYEKEARFAELNKNPDFKWYFSTKDSNKFDELKAWKITFEEHFDNTKLEEEKWMNSFFWGKMLINDRYVMAGDRQYYTDNKNIEISDSSLKILTKKETANGKVWHPLHGFTQQQFEYTSGMLSTAHSFRQQYGRFEAKIKLNSEFPVYQAFWLKGEKILPELDILKFNMDKKNKLQMANFWGENAQSSQANKTNLGGGALANNYFIYSIDWTENKISWKINGLEVHSSTQGIPSEPMYLMLSAGIHNGVEPGHLPTAFEIDWVRCYEKVN